MILYHSLNVNKKFKKPHKIFLKGKQLDRYLSDFSMVSKENKWLTEKELEATRKVIQKVIKKKKGKVIVRVKPYLPLFKKSLGLRMGKGKGSKVNRWVYPIRPGKVMFEVKNIRIDNLALKSLNLGSEKLSIKTLVTKYMK